VDPTGVVPKGLLTKALAYYNANLSKLGNAGYLTVIDFGQHSKGKRFYLINMTTGSVWQLHVAHGVGTDPNHTGTPQKFSNTSGSRMSSLGFYLTAETYSGNNGLSLRLDGLSSTNSKARSRAIVLHGANYVVDDDIKQGRSWGCPAVPMRHRDQIVRMLKGGSLIYAGLAQ
jgi:hypothetical protein